MEQVVIIPQDVWREYQKNQREMNRRIQFMEKRLPPNMTKAEAADYLKISEATVDRLCKPGEPLAPAFKKEGKKCLYDAWLVYEYDQTRYVEPAANLKIA